ncbi:MAG: outer membrane lipid asymmetry maintenance protein MlaD [Syntrophotaleaceae bacterium]
MKRLNIELAVGVFLVAGFVCFAYLSIKLGDIRLFGDPTYQVSARFHSVSGLKQGDVVEMAGVQVGKVKGITLDPQDYEAVVQLELQGDVRLQEDAIASIRTAGIIGSKFIDITPGGLEDTIEPGGEIFETQSAINLEQLVSKYIFEKK